MDEFGLKGGGGQGRDKPSPYDLDGEGDVVVAVEDLGNPIEDVAHAPLISQVEDVIPMHAGGVFAQEEDEVDVAMEAGVEGFVVPEVEAEVQEGDFGGEAVELEAGAVWVGLGGVPDVIEVNGEGGLPPGKGEEVSVEVDVDARGVAPGDFEGDVGRDGFCNCRSGLGA